MRLVTSDFEANLWGEQDPGLLTKWFGWRFKGLFGEIEVESYSDGHKKMEIEFKRMRVPEGSRLGVVIDGETVCEVMLTQTDYLKKVFDTSRGEQVPDVSKGTKVEVHYEGNVLLEGVFLKD